MPAFDNAIATACTYIMFNVKFHFPAKEEFELFFSRYRAEIQKGLYDGSVLLNKDIIAKSKEPKTGRIYPRKLKSGRIVKGTLNDCTY